MTTTIKAYCHTAGPQALGPGVSQTNVSLLAPAGDNTGVFSKPTGVGGLNFSDTTKEFAAQFEPGKRYEITVKEVVETPAE